MKAAKARRWFSWAKQKPLMNEPLTVHERLVRFFDRLQHAPPCADANEAFTLVCRTLEKVEDEFSGVEKALHPGLKFDGRMYPPQADFTHEQSDGSKIAFTKGHELRFGRDGSISILSQTTGLEEFFKEGHHEDI